MQRLPLAAVLIFISSLTAGAADPLAHVLDLYQAAAYEQVLAALDEVNTTSAEVPLRTVQKAHEYRALSLIALKRNAEAELVVTDLIELDPLYQPDADSSPRWVNAVTDARARVLPGVIRSAYSAAKQHFDAKEYSKAIAGFESVRDILDAAKREAADAGLENMPTLVDGYLDLSRTALRQASSARPTGDGIRN